MYIIPPNATCILIRSYGCCYENFNVFWLRSDNNWDMEYRSRDGIDLCSRYNMILSCAKCEHWDKGKGICPVPLRIIPDDVLEMAILFAQTEDEYDVWYHTGDPAELRDPNLCCYLHKQRCTFDQFLTNPKRMMEYILAAGAIDWEMYFSDGDEEEVRK